ncbi:uncharacterized protein NECHADRAFT_102254 [Fusarium vanettenii 77-13-4]|uniref:Uncharacterized protein n=1 Tax=Fusarium vanettenii (strain ATCC MYA-4622 / CBS 123669 / FGSC 9596 / NRRL 45880 / 77-13-4) TaxID=660122 RepID=C7ZBM6_FUSV7|nr:uncharacterized protein NECHADRAFT_102254 [Fusarium vanettenii 77-13-4]EEU38622.1 hypothetical protein NECHADRAFT_102254 [Fusarium vanettenii 77-13-4]
MVAAPQQTPSTSDVAIGEPLEIHELPDFKPVERWERAYPESKHIPLLLDPALCNMIVKKDNQACIMVSNPPHLNGDSRLVMDICAEDVEYLALKLFELRIRTRDGMRQVVSNRGTFRSILGFEHYNGSDASTWNGLFGNIVADAMYQSYMRVAEILNGDIWSCWRSMCDIEMMRDPMALTELSG